MHTVMKNIGITIINTLVNMNYLKLLTELRQCNVLPQIHSSCNVSVAFKNNVLA